jgi:hypothetical protein
MLSASAAFIFHDMALVIVVCHPFLSSGVVAVLSGKGVSGSVFVIRVWGSSIVIGSAVRCGVHYRMCALSASWVVVAACHGCISLWVGDVSRHFCSSCWCIVGDCCSVLLYSLFGECFLFPAGLHTMSRISLMPCCTLYSCRDISSMAEGLRIGMAGEGGGGCHFFFFSLCSP